jgi:hypothetical protein
MCEDFLIDAHPFNPNLIQRWIIAYLLERVSLFIVLLQPQLFNFFFKLINNFIQSVVPIQMRTPSGATSVFGADALGIFPDFPAGGTSPGSGECVPPMTARACPVRLTIRLPFALRTTNMNAFHIF